MFLPGSLLFSFTVDAERALEHVRKGDALILDVRPTDYYRGKKSEEAQG